MKKKELILIGAGGHACSCIDVIELAGQYNIAGIVDLPAKLHQKVLGYEIFATDRDLPELAKEYNCFFISISFGSVSEHSEEAIGHLVLNLHPFGRLSGLGISPSKRILFRARDLFGSGIGVADNSAFV